LKRSSWGFPLNTKVHLCKKLVKNLPVVRVKIAEMDKKQNKKKTKKTKKKKKKKNEKAQTTQHFSGFTMLANWIAPK
jgi:hypothetical protein